MPETVSIILASAFINHTLVTQGIGLGPALAIKPDFKAILLLVSFTVVVVILSLSAYTLASKIFLISLNIERLKIPCLLLLVVISIEFTDVFLSNLDPAKRFMMGALTPLSVANTSILSLSVITILKANIPETLLVLSGAVFTLTSIRLCFDKIPLPFQFRGLPIDLMIVSFLMINLNIFFPN